jgi:hypothetical protein
MDVGYGVGQCGQGDRAAYRIDLRGVDYRSCADSPVFGSNASGFSLATMLYADDVREGTIDFFNTAKVSGVSVSDGGTLTSLSGTLTMGTDGTYGYPAAAAVPEPATWAMMIGGFGLIGAASRRRARTSITYA